MWKINTTTMPLCSFCLLFLHYRCIADCRQWCNGAQQIGAYILYIFSTSMFVCFLCHFLFVHTSWLISGRPACSLWGRLWLFSSCLYRPDGSATQVSRLGFPTMTDILFLLYCLLLTSIMHLQKMNPASVSVILSFIQLAKTHYSLPNIIAS